MVWMSGVVAPICGEYNRKWCVCVARWLGRPEAYLKQGRMVIFHDSYVAYNFQQVQVALNEHDLDALADGTDQYSHVMSPAFYKPQSTEKMSVAVC